MRFIFLFRGCGLLLYKIIKMAKLPIFSDLNIISEISLRDRANDIENEINQMHLLLNKLCPGTYGAIGSGPTVAERFEEFLKAGPEWVGVKKGENK